MEKLELEQLENLIKNKSFEELSKEEQDSMAHLFEDDLSYNEYRHFLLKLSEESIDFPDEINQVVYHKLHEDRDHSLPLVTFFRYAAMAVLFLGLGFLSAWFIKPKQPGESTKEYITQTDTIRITKEIALLDTVYIEKEITNTEIVEVLVYQEASSFEPLDSAMLFADSVEWNDHAIVLNNNLKNRQELHVFYNN